MDNNENNFDIETTKDYTEEYNDQIESTIELQEDFFEEKNSKRKKIITIVLIVLFVLAIAAVLVYFLVIKKKDKPVEEEPKNETVVIERPSDTLDYTVLKQSPVGLYCYKTKNGDKIKTLTKNMVIECNLEFELKQRVSELYFDLSNSTNIKLDEYKNDSDYKIETDGTTYKLTTSTPTSVLNGPIKFYFKVLNSSDNNGYTEMKNIIFKDDGDVYYKVLNNIITFPPEYNDKIYIYLADFEEDYEYYYTSKNKDEENLEEGIKLVDTFQCKNDTCEEQASYDNYFLIYDDTFILYDTLNKSKTTVKLPEDFKVEDYSYELMMSNKKNVYGIAFKKNYHDELDCDTYEDFCIETGLSGYDIGYYSMSEKMFTVDLDFGFYGSTAYNDYDKALLLKKGNKYGIYSYEDDEMILELTNKYTAMSYDSETDLVKLEVIDDDNNEYYYNYFNINNKSFKVDVSSISKFDNSSLYYTTSYNRQGHSVTMLFTSKGEQHKKIPYVLTNNLVSVTNKIIIKDGNLYNVYDLDGNLLYKTKYTTHNVLNQTESYLVIKTDDNKIELEDLEGKTLVTVVELTDTMSYVSSSEANDILTIYIKDTSIEEEGKNGYKYTIKYNEPFVRETVKID